MRNIILVIWGLVMSNLVACSDSKDTIRVATYNVSMEADNYRINKSDEDPTLLFKHLSSGNHQQIKNIAEVIQRVRPDVILLNEFDHNTDPKAGPVAFIKNYLHKSQNNQKSIDYPYFFYGPVNTGVPSNVDLNHDGVLANGSGDAFGYGRYPGQYGMLLLSRFPIDKQKIRTFQKFLWKDMPNALIDEIKGSDGSNWYSPAARQVMRLSSKSHWDIPVLINGEVVHILASHPTPPVFDGPENRNGMRNHDEIRFWNDYIQGGESADYIYDDNGMRGGFNGQRFVLLGDLNASKSGGEGMRSMMADLQHHDKVLQLALPASEGGAQNKPDNPQAKYHTAQWGLTVDYVLVSRQGFESVDAGVFWPIADNEAAHLLRTRQATSDHRLVWRELQLK